MASRLKIFISAGPDLDIEREVVGKAIASLPVSLGWVVKYTPIRGEPADPASSAVQSCGLYVLILGSDIAAPVGSELYTARKSGKGVEAFLKEGPRTSAARAFMKEAAIQWKPFGNEVSLRSLLQKSLASRMLKHPEAYRLSIADWEALSALTAEPERETADQRQEATTPHGGAGTDAVIVSPERDLPSQAVLIEGGHDTS
jgi:hypothetical protein